MGVVAAIVFALIGNDKPAEKTDAKQPPVPSPVVEETPTPRPPRSESPAPPRPKAPAPVARTAPKPTPSPTPTPTPTRRPSPTPTPSPTPPRAPAPTTPAPAPTPPPPPAPVEYRWNELAYDVSGDGSGPEMRLAESSWVWQRQGLSIAGRRYEHGVTVHGRSSVTIDLNRRCTAYEARAGVDDSTLGLGRFTFSVRADGVRLWSSGTVKAGEAAVPVQVDLTGRRTVQLVVEPHSAFGTLLPVDWAESKFRCS
ncbi:NPCBM/NEW2 domain-containing protein [Streptomyces sp. NPDC003514]